MAVLPKIDDSGLEGQLSSAFMTTNSHQVDQESSARKASLAGATGERRRWWQFRVWHGMTAPAWFRLLWDNRFAVAPSRLFLLTFVTGASCLNFFLSLLQKGIYGWKIQRTTLAPDPIIILGHWRSGTTLLHELLSLDPRHHFPSTYACLAPEHFLVSQPLVQHWLRFLMPKRRSQDNVRVALDAPQEDEWAICAMGLPTPYRTAGFPNRLPHGEEYLTLQNVPPKDLRRWKRKWQDFLKAVSLEGAGKRLVLKSPLQTARLPLLLEVFPQARFVHIVRDPREVYQSTLRLWRRLAEDEGLQMPTPAAFEAFVLNCYSQMYEAYHRTVHLIPADRLCEIGYEDLVADPMETLRRLYQQLNLGNADRLPEAMHEMAARMAEFPTNTYLHSPAVDAKISAHWSSVRRQSRDHLTTPSINS